MANRDADLQINWARFMGGKVGDQWWKDCSLHFLFQEGASDRTERLHQENAEDTTSGASARDQAPPGVR